MNDKKIIDRGQINGVEVISTGSVREPVIPGQPERDITVVEKVLLLDETEWYRCKMNPTECNYAHKTLRSVLAHTRSHSPKIIARRAATQLAKIKKKEDAEFARRSAGVTAARDAKRKRYAVEVTSTDNRVASLQRRLSDTAVAIEKFVATFSSTAEVIRALNAELGKLVSESLAKEAEIDIDRMSTEEKFRLIKQLMS